MATNRNAETGDIHTILRHLVDVTQWGGNQGAKAETMEALDRLTSNQSNDDEPEPTDERSAADVIGSKGTTPAKTTGSARR